MGTTFSTPTLPIALAEVIDRETHVAELLEALETIADFAVGHGDVCEIIARRARAAILKAKERT